MKSWISTGLDTYQFSLKSGNRVKMTLLNFFLASCGVEIEGDYSFAFWLRCVNLNISFVHANFQKQIDYQTDWLTGQVNRVVLQCKRMQLLSSGRTSSVLTWTEQKSIFLMKNTVAMVQRDIIDCDFSHCRHCLRHTSTKISCGFHL